MTGRSLRYALVVTAAMLLAACMGDVDRSRSAVGEIYEEPTSCQIIGTGIIDGTDIGTGDISGTGSSGIGVWAHVSAGGDVYSVLADTVTCRINGIAIGESTGTIAGTTHTYLLHVEDADGGHPAPQASAVLTASRAYSPSEWTDGSIEGPLSFVVPSEIPVTGGSAGNGWLHLSFVRADSLDEITCRYRGTGANPHADADSYVLTRCTGEADGTDSVAGGDTVDALSVSMHVQSGGLNAGDTEASIELELEPGPPADSDFYLFTVVDAGGALVYESAGYVDGDFSVISLD